MSLRDPRLLLVLSRALQALATPLIAFLVTSALTLTDAKNPISYCNVLFIGNTCAALTVLAFFGPRRIWRELKALHWKHRLGLVAFGGLAALLSTLIYIALSSTSVTNTVLIARLGPVLYAASAAWMFGQVIKKGEWLGFGFITVGTVVTVAATGGFGKGELLIVGSSVVYAVVNLMSRWLLKHTGLAVVVFSRNFFSAIIFFSIATAYYGPEHFADALSGRLWMVMAVYSLVVIVAAQFAWYQALRSLDSATIAKWTLVSPLLAVLYAFLLNGETPSKSQILALALVTGGLVIANLGKFAPKGVADNPEGSLAGS